MDPLAIADLWLGHQIKTDVYGYRDIMRRKTELLVSVGAGDRERGIPGVADRLFGEASARKAWDDEAIRAEYDGLQHGQERAGELRVQIAAARADHDRLLRAPLQIAIPDPEPLPAIIAEMLAIDPAVLAQMSHRDLSERMLVMTAETTAMLHRGQERTNQIVVSATNAADSRVRDLSRVSAEIDRLGDARHDAERVSDRAEMALEKLEVRGRTRPIHDMDRTTAELRVLTADPTIRAPEDETWQHMLARISAHHAPTAADRCRAWLNQPELQALTGLNARAIQRARAGESTNPLARGIQRARWANEGPKLWFVRSDTLPLHLFLPTQLEFLDELLRVPMGAFHSGRQRSDAELEAADQVA